jgi:hypothetical protein
MRRKREIQKAAAEDKKAEAYKRKTKPNSTLAAKRKVETERFRFNRADAQQSQGYKITERDLAPQL